MSFNKLILPEELHDYMLSVSLREAEALKKLRKETACIPERAMQIPPEQGQFLAMLVRMLGATRALEVGVFTGYSALSVALAMPPEGRVIACDVNEEWTGVAKRYWEKAGVSEKIDLRIAPAMETLDALILGGERDRFDFAFIDADKENYPGYYERCLTLIRPGGLIALDNTFLDGKVIDEGDDGADSKAIRSLNQTLHTDERVELSMVPIADGLTLALKR